MTEVLAVIISKAATLYLATWYSQYMLHKFSVDVSMWATLPIGAVLAGFGELAYDVHKLANKR